MRNRFETRKYTTTAAGMPSEMAAKNAGITLSSICCCWFTCDCGMRPEICFCWM